MYKKVHSLHHRNTNIGPWSGLSMHPIEHLLFFSSILQMHHRYFECNYGTLEVPWDRVFGSYHDGTTQSHQQFQERRRKTASVE